VVWRAMTSFILVLATCIAARAQTERGTRIEFESFARGRREPIVGYLSLPVRPRIKYPLMLIMHSSGGIHERDWFGPDAQ
jgi:hypothetical protein